MRKTLRATAICLALITLPADAKTHFIRGRLVCAINVNKWLAAHGFRPTRSALAASFLRYRRVAPAHMRFGDVRFNYREGGGHVMIVLAKGQCLNPSTKRQAWVDKLCPAGGIYVRAS